MARITSFQKTISEIVVIIGGAGSIFAIVLFISSTYNPTQIEPPTKFEKQMETMHSEIGTLTKQVKAVQQVIETAQYDPNIVAIANLQTDIEQLSNEVKSLKDALGSDIERTLSVPLLRKDIQKIEGQLGTHTTGTSKAIDRIYDLNKWFIGLIGTMALGLIGLAVGNIYQAKKKEDKD